MKLEAMMEHLQRHQEAKLEMNLQEKHLQAQLMFAQHAAAARASGSRLDSALFGNTDGQTYPAAQQAFSSHFSGTDPGEEEEDSDEEEDELVGPKEDNEVDDDDKEEEEEEENSPHQQAKRARLQQIAGFSFPPYTTSHLSAIKQMVESPPLGTKQEHEKEMESPAGHQAFTSPNGFTDWGYDEQFKQVSCLQFDCPDHINFAFLNLL